MEIRCSARGTGAGNKYHRDALNQPLRTYIVLNQKMQAFDPNFAHANVDQAFIDSMAVIKPLSGLGMLGNLKHELPLYLAAAQSAPAFDKSDISSHTDGLLKWWRTQATTLPAWASAARVAFALSPNSASCECVFALVKRMYDDQQISSLSDQIQAALMLAFNERRVG